MYPFPNEILRFAQNDNSLLPLYIVKLLDFILFGFTYS